MFSASTATLAVDSMIPTPDLTFELGLWKSGLRFIAGLDEAGRGALAGPVAVGAVILPDDDPHLASTLRHSLRSQGGALSGLRDSKLMTPLERSRLAPLIQASARSWGVGFASAEEIDELGIVASTRLAALRALEALTLFPDYLLTDFRLELPELDVPQTSLVKGDQKSLSIAAASVLAKTARDALMRELDGQYPGYELGRHKGYGTQIHRAAITRLGYSPIHRRSFKFVTPQVAAQPSQISCRCEPSGGNLRLSEKPFFARITRLPGDCFAEVRSQRHG